MKFAEKFTLFTFHSIILCLLVTAGTVSAQNLLVHTDREDAHYNLGDTVTFTAELTDLPDQELSYTILENHLTPVDKGTLSFANGTATVQATFKNPGFLFLSIKLPEKLAEMKNRDKHAGLGGAVCEPEQLQPALPKPDDFDAFWNAKKAIVDQVPFNARLEKIESQSNDQVDVFHLIFDSYNNTKAYCTFARPKKKGKYPIIMFTNGAGVGPVSQTNVKEWAAKGAIALNINAHDIPNDQPKEFYAELKAGKLKGYPLFGRDDRGTSYFLRMFLSCYQATRYLTSLKEWDKKHFMVYGSSQGGGQAYATAYLSDKVTAFYGNVSALCDHAGREAGRKPGWPQWVDYSTGSANTAQLEAGRYYDCVNFARTIKANALMSCGFIDTCCAPGSVYTAYNMLPGKKRMVEMPLAVHEIPKMITDEANAFAEKEMELR